MSINCLTRHFEWLWYAVLYKCLWRCSVIQVITILFCTGLAFHIMKYYILRTVYTSQGYLIHMCICVLIQLNSMVYNVLYSINVYMHRLVIMHSILKCMYRCNYSNCVCMTTTIEQHTPTDLFNVAKKLNNLYPGPNRCCIMNRSMIDETCVSRNQ